MASKNRQRVLNRMMNMGPGGRVTNWIVGGTAVNSSGTVISSPPTTWTPNSSGLVLAPGSGFNFQAVVIQPVPASGTPSIGRLKIDEVRGCLSFGGNTSSGTCFVGVAIYISDINATTSAWNVRNPTVAADAARDDYLFLKMIGLDLTAYAAGGQLENRIMAELELSISSPVLIGGGQALNVGVYSAGSSQVSLQVNSAFRTRVGPVA